MTTETTCRYCDDPVIRVGRWWFHKTMLKWHMHAAEPYAAQRSRR